MSTQSRAPGSFRDLKVWREAVALAVEANALADRLPGRHAALAEQMRRSAGSIHANIAEGTARRSRREYLRFLDVARGSFAEVESHVAAARAAGYLTPSATAPFETRARRVGALLPALIRSLDPRT